MAVIHCKTAKLFEAAAAQLGVVLAGRPEAEERALARFGLHLGTAFQLIDDVLDYNASSAELGKNIGDDLAEGKPTLPLIHAMRHGTPEQARIIREAIEHGGLEYIEIVTRTIGVHRGAGLYFASCRAGGRTSDCQLGTAGRFKRQDALVGLAASVAINRHS